MSHVRMDFGLVIRSCQELGLTKLIWAPNEVLPLRTEPLDVSDGSVREQLTKQFGWSVGVLYFDTLSSLSRGSFTVNRPPNVFTISF